MVATQRLAGAAILACLVAGPIATGVARAGGARAPAEVATRGETAWETILRRRQLHERLVSELPPEALAARMTVELSAAEEGDLERADPSERRVRVGLVKAIGRRIAFGRTDAAKLSPAPRSAAGGVLRATEDGGFVWAAAIESSGAAGLRLQLTEVHLPPGVMLYVFGPGGDAFGPYTGRGADGKGEVWTNTVTDDVVFVLIRHPGPDGASDLRQISFVLEAVGHLGPRFLAERTAAPRSLCENNATCVENASCHEHTPADAAKSAVALMQWVSGNYLYACSGGLIADNDPTTEIPYFLSANHCIARQQEAQSLECFFQYQAACGASTCPSKNGFPRTLGATLKKTNATSDYTLLQLHQSPPAGSVFLGWNSEPVAFTEGAELYRISHPLASPQAFSAHRVSTTAPTCAGWERGPWIYSRDVVGATQGGSSGSPVVNASGEVVGQFSGACGFRVGDVCDSESNASVDGAFASYYADIARFLGPGNVLSGICGDGGGDGQSVCAGFGKGALLVKKSGGKEKLLVRMTGGPGIAQTDFGDPLVQGGTRYTLCLYDDTSALVAELPVDRAGHTTCSGGSTACWDSLGPPPPGGTGYRYKDSDGAASGVAQIRLQGGALGKSKIIVRGEVSLPAPIAASLTSTTSATMQLRGHDAPGLGCWAITLRNIKKQTADWFKAR